MPETKQPSGNQKPTNNQGKWGFLRGRWFWLWVLYVVLILTGLSIGNCYFDKGADRAKFWVEGIMSAAILSAVIVQVVINRKQWKVMQGELISTLYSVRPIIEIEAYFRANMIEFELSNVGKSPATVQFKCTVTLNGRIILERTQPEFEIGDKTQKDRGRWTRRFPADVTPEEVAEIQNGELAPQMELVGMYKWEAGSYPINECWKYGGDTVRRFYIPCQ